MEGKLLFHINEEKKIIVAIAEKEDYRAIIGKKILNLCPYSYEILDAMPSKIIGRAKCSPDDEWNEVLGCDLAEDRVTKRVFLSFMDLLYKFSQENKLRERETYEKVSGKICKIMDRIEEKS